MFTLVIQWPLSVTDGLFRARASECEFDVCQCEDARVPVPLYFLFVTFQLNLSATPLRHAVVMKGQVQAVRKQTFTGINIEFTT